jgi:hypothetical protein
MLLYQETELQLRLISTEYNKQLMMIDEQAYFKMSLLEFDLMTFDQPEITSLVT